MIGHMLVLNTLLGDLSKCIWSFSQEFDYSKMSETERILFYSEMKKSPVAAGFLEFFISWNTNINNNTEDNIKTNWIII